MRRDDPGLDAGRVRSARVAEAMTPLRGLLEPGAPAGRPEPAFSAPAGAVGVPPTTSPGAPGAPPAHVVADRAPGGATADPPTGGATADPPPGNVGAARGTGARTGGGTRWQPGAFEDMLH